MFGCIKDYIWSIYNQNSAFFITIKLFIGYGPFMDIADAKNHPKRTVGLEKRKYGFEKSQRS